MALKDYVNTGDNTAHLIYYGATQPRGQSFTVTTGYTPRRVKLKLYRVGSPGPILVTIQEVEPSYGHPPIGDVICSKTYDGDSLSTSPTWTEIVFDVYGALSDGAFYTVDISCTILSDSDNYVKWRLDSTTLYDEGCIHWYTGTPPQYWDYSLTADYMFEVYNDLGEDPELSKPTTPTPADASGPGIDFSTRTLSWVDGGGAETYTVRIGPYPLAYNVVSLSQAGTSYVIPESDIPLYKDNPIAWRVDAESDGATAEGDVWTFDPRPAKPTTPTPESAATEQKLTQTFEWVDGGGSATYDVWIGSNRILNNTAGLSYLVPDTYLGYKSEYTWRVDAANVWGTTTGDNWTFTTFALDPPSPTYYYPDGNYWYYLLTTDDGWGDPPPTGTENVDYMITGNINMMSAHRKLMACAADRLWYET